MIKIFPFRRINRHLLHILRMEERTFIWISILFELLITLLSQKEFQNNKLFYWSLVFVCLFFALYLSSALL